MKVEGIARLILRRDGFSTGVNDCLEDFPRTFLFSKKRQNDCLYLRLIPTAVRRELR